MIRVLQRRGFWGLVAMASWPNAAFDLCGICCGQFGMPFVTFLSATALGKGFIKAPMQARSPWAVATRSLGPIRAVANNSCSAVGLFPPVPPSA